MTKQAFERIAAGLHEAIAIARGDLEPARQTTAPAKPLDALIAALPADRRAKVEARGHQLIAAERERRAAAPEPTSRPGRRRP